VVHEHVFAAVIWCDEAKALLVGKPLDRSLGHVPLNPAFLFLGFSARDEALLIMLAGCAPAALKPIATAASIIVVEKEELGALEKTPVPFMSPGFQELYEDG